VLAPTWADPVVAGTRVLAEAGRLPSAVEAAVQAEIRGAEDPGVALLLTAMRSANDPGLPVPATRGCSRRGRSRTQHPETLGLRLAVTAAARDDDATRRLIEEALGAEAAGRPAGDVLLAGALLSRARGLRLEGRCFERYEALYGNTPSLALALAKSKEAEGTGGVSPHSERDEPPRPTGMQPRGRGRRPHSSRRRDPGTGPDRVEGRGRGRSRRPRAPESLPRCGLHLA